MLNENKIRDFLADSLFVVEDHLTLIQKEYHLPNDFGSKGFIDILAKDQYNNFVIIEIKRSKATSRETIQEIIKYVALLKQNYLARDSEIRIIILSTDWNELIVPFSELLQQTALNVLGFKLHLDARGNPISKESIAPIAINKIRNLSRTTFFYLFENDGRREHCIRFLEKRCGELGIHNYLFVKLAKAKSEQRSMPYPYSLYLSFQELSVQEYKSIIGKPDDELDLQQDESDEEEFISYLEQEFLILLDTYGYHDSVESGNPEKFVSVIMMQNWEVEFILRYGIFSSDPRFTDDILFAELKGVEGSSNVKYLRFGESSNKNLLHDIREEIQRPLKDNLFWLNHLHSTFDYLIKLKRPFRFVFDIYHPESLFDNIWRALHFNNYDYLPIYHLLVDMIDKQETFVYSGKIGWDGDPVDVTAVEKYLRDNRDSFINKFIDCVTGLNDSQLLPLYHLQFQNTFKIFSGSSMTVDHQISFVGGEAVTRNSEAIDFCEWQKNNPALKTILDRLYRTYTNAFIILIVLFS